MFWVLDFLIKLFNFIFELSIFWSKRIKLKLKLSNIFSLINKLNNCAFCTFIFHIYCQINIIILIRIVLIDLTQDLSTLSEPHFACRTIHIVPDWNIRFQNERGNWTFVFTIDILINFLSSTVKSNFWNGILFFMFICFGTLNF